MSSTLISSVYEGIKRQDQGVSNFRSEILPYLKVAYQLLSALRPIFVPLSLDTRDRHFLPYYQPKLQRIEGDKRPQTVHFRITFYSSIRRRRAFEISVSMIWTKCVSCRIVLCVRRVHPLCNPQPYNPIMADDN